MMTAPCWSTGEPIAAGDWVRVFVKRLGVWHHGIIRSVLFCGNGFAVQIAHNTKGSGVAITSWEVFSEGELVELRRRPAASDIAKILARVDRNLGVPYRFFEQNCEHFASFCFTGTAQSESMQILTWATLGLGALALLASQSQ